MRQPTRANQLRIQNSLIPYGSLVEKIVRPFLEGATKPACERRHEARFRPLEQPAGYITCKNLAEQRFSFAILGVYFRRDSPCERNNPVIQKGYARFKTGRHRCAIHFRKDVVRQISEEIDQTKLIDQLGQFLRNSAIPMKAGTFRGIQDKLCRPGPAALQLPVKRQAVPFTQEVA